MRDRVEKNRYEKLNESSDNEQGWIYSYADLMSLLLGFFIILYSFSQMSDKQLQSITRDISQTFKGEEGQKQETKSEVGMINEQRQLKAMEVLLSLMEIAPTEAEAIEKIEKAAQNKETLDELKKKTEQMALKNDLNHDEKAPPKDWLLDVTLSSRLLFKKGTAVLLPVAQTELRKIVPEILSLEDRIYVKIIGHSDTSAEDLGVSFQNHWALTTSRSAAVASFLIEQGVDPLTLEVIGRSYYEPLFPEFTAYGDPLPENMKKNRRVHIQFYRRSERERQ